DVGTAQEAARAGSGHGTVVVANVNHPGQTVLSGETPAVRAAAEWLEGRGIAVTWLDVSHAFHSPLVGGIADAMRGIASALPLQQPPGAVLSAAKALPYPADPEEVRQIFVEHATAPVDFVSTLRAAAGLGARLFVQGGGGR